MTSDATETLEDIRAVLAARTAYRARNWHVIQESSGEDYLVQEVLSEPNSHSIYPVVAFKRKGDAELVTQGTAIMDTLVEAIDSGDGWACWLAVTESQDYFWNSSIMGIATDERWFTHVPEGKSYRVMAAKHMSGRIVEISDGFYLGGEIPDYIAHIPDRITALHKMAHNVRGYGW